MTRNKAFLIVSLIAMTAAGSALADTTATREWVKAQVYDKYIEPQGNALNTINKRLATDVRDKIYTYDKNTKTVSNPLRTEGQNAFDGVNEVLEKVDGNNGEAGSAVQLQTTSKNAFGAINELKGEIDSISVPTKISDLTNDSEFVTSSEVPTKISDLTNDSDFVTSSEVPTKISDLTNDSNFVTTEGVEDGVYLYTSEGWSEMQVRKAFPSGLTFDE